jgi:hypothetical protein
MSETTAKTIDPAALSIDDAARLLTKAGGRIVTEAMLQQDIDAGAPTNADGTINLVNFTAWLVQEMARGD